LDGRRHDAGEFGQEIVAGVSGWPPLGRDGNVASPGLERAHSDFGLEGRAGRRYI
jgi:hypothetical protein